MPMVILGTLCITACSPGSYQIARGKDISFCVPLPCNHHASRRTFSIKMNEMGLFQFQLPTAEKISMINYEIRNNNHDYIVGSNISFSIKMKTNGHVP